MRRFVHERQFSRETFLKGGGALVFGFSFAGAGLTAAARAADPYASNAPYDYTSIDSWLVVHADNTVTAKLGKEDLGQGSGTGLLMIIAEELDLKLSQLKHQSPD